MEALSSSAEQAVGVAMRNPMTGIRDARRPKLPTRAKPRATVIHPPNATTFYSITSPSTAEYENLNFNVVNLAFRWVWGGLKKLQTVRFLDRHLQSK
jgi:hypothetical protein